MTVAPSAKTSNVPPRKSRGGQWRVVLFILIAVVVLAGGILLMGRGKIRSWYWRNQCLNYDPPVDQIVYFEDPVRAPLLPQNDMYRPSVATLGVTPYVGRSAPVLDRYNADGTAVTPVFLHGRRVGKGPMRLVEIFPPVNGARADALRDAQTQVQVILMASIDGSSPASPHQLTLGPASLAENDNRPLYLQMYAGRADPDDESHFTINYKFGEIAGVIHGWLQSDDTFKMAAHW